MYRKHELEDENIQQPTIIWNEEAPPAVSGQCTATQLLNSTMIPTAGIAIMEGGTSTRPSLSPPSSRSKRQRQLVNEMEDVCIDNNDHGDHMMIEASPSSSVSFEELPMPAPHITGSSLPTNAPSTDPDQILVDMIMQFAKSQSKQDGLSPHGECLSYSKVVEFCRSSGIPISRMLRLDLLGLCQQEDRLSSIGVPPPSAMGSGRNDSSFSS